MEVLYSYCAGLDVHTHLAVVQHSIANKSRGKFARDEPHSIDLDGSAV